MNAENTYSAVSNAEISTKRDRKKRNYINEIRHTERERVCRIWLLNTKGTEVGTESNP
jgi:hypothetical protein